MRGIHARSLNRNPIQRIRFLLLQSRADGLISFGGGSASALSNQLRITVSGSHVAMPGNTVMSAMHTSMRQKNGIDAYAT